MGILNDYKVCFPEQGVFVSGDHNWAFAAWELKKIYSDTENATLIHVDSHLDDIWDGILVDGVLDIKNQIDAYKVTEKLQIENFIWAGFATNAIDNVIYVTRKTSRFQVYDPFNLSEWDFSSIELEPVRKLLERKKYQGVRLESIEELVIEKYNMGLNRFIDGKKVILDLDLDYFNLSDDMEPSLISDELIRKNLETLRDLFEWDLITVALSPLFCGGDDLCWHIYEIFLDVFNLDLKKAEIW